MSTILDRLGDLTVARHFVQTARSHPEAPALRWREGDGWGAWNYADYADRVARAAAGLRERGVGAGDRVVLMIRNRPEFHVLDVAALTLGATPISIYNSSSPEQLEYLVNHCGGVLAIVDDDAFLERLVAVRAALPSLKSVGVVKGSGTGADFTWDDLMAADPVDLEAEAARGDAADLATVIYTSGTTGPPKGVMISHRNVLFMGESIRQILPFEETIGKRLVSYLPMAHIAERMVSHYQQIMLGYEVTSCPDMTQVASYLTDVRPHVLFGVPRVYEKLYAGVNAALAADPDRAQKFAEAVEAAKPIALRRSWGTASEEDEATWSFLDDVAFKQVRQLLGLDEVLLGVTGAAPIPRELLEWFRAIGVPLSEVYGMSENTGAMTWTAERIKPGTVGPALPETEVTVAEDGEVICRGPHVFQGYLDDPERTAEALSPDGWLHTGDIGEMDEDGYLRIVDRKKELIITAGGKNISPANLEAALKMIPIVGQAATIGDQRPFVSALVSLDPDTAPAWARQQGIEFSSLAELAEDPAVVAEVERWLDTVMEPFNQAERVKKVKVVGEEWLPDSDVLTPTSKLKRRGINTRYADEIEALYT